MRTEAEIAQIMRDRHNVSEYEAARVAAVIVRANRRKGAPLDDGDTTEES